MDASVVAVAVAALEQQRTQILQEAQEKASQLDEMIRTLQKESNSSTDNSKIRVKPGQFRDLEMWEACILYLNEIGDVAVSIPQMAVDLASGGQKTLAGAVSAGERLRRLRICLGHHARFLQRDLRNDTVRLDLSKSKKDKIDKQLLLVGAGRSRDPVEA